MSNALTFILKLQDMLTPGMRQAAQISNTAAAQIESQFARIGSGGRRMNASVDELRSRLEAVNRVRFGTTIEREFNTATRAAQRLERQIDTMQNGRGRSGGGGMLGGLLAGIGVGAVAKEALGQAANAENQKVAFKVLTGSKKEGDALYTNISDMADATPYESKDLGRSAKTMLGYGVDKKQILPTLGMLGDISAAADDPAQSLQSLALAFGQVSAKGHLAGQETLQMINAGFNPLKEISDATGISMESLSTAQGEGAITSAMVAAAFQHATGEGGKFHNMMIEQSNTLGGKWSTFMDGVHHKLRDLGEFLRPVAMYLMEFATALLNGEGPALAIAVAIGGIALALSWSTLAVYAQSTAFGVLNAIMNLNPMVLIITLVIALGIWIYSLSQKYEGWGQSMNAIWEIIKAFGTLAFLPFKIFAETAWYFVQKLWYNIKDFAQSVVQIFEKVGKAWEMAKAGNFSGAKAALAENVQTNASKELVALEAGHASNTASYANQALAAQKSITDNYSKIGLTKIASTTKAVSIGGNTKMDKTAFDGLKDYSAAGEDGGKSKSDSINSGGQRSVIINIAKQIEKIEQHIIGGGKEVADEIETAVREAMRRVAYSLNGAISN